MKIVTAVPESQVILHQKADGSYNMVLSKYTFMAIKNALSHIMPNKDHDNFMEILPKIMINIAMADEHQNNSSLKGQRYEQGLAFLNNVIMASFEMDNNEQRKNKQFIAYFTGMFYQLGKIPTDDAGLKAIVDGYKYCSNYIDKRGIIVADVISSELFHYALDFYKNGYDKDNISYLTQL